MIMLDLACGQHKQPGYLGVDIVEMPGVDIVCDLTKFPWPWENDSIDGLYASHYLEHTLDLIAFMNECHRILKKGCALHTVSPYYTSMRCWQDPTHVRALCEKTAHYFNKAIRDGGGLNHYPITADFNFTYAFLLEPEWQNKTDEEKQFAHNHYMNVVADIVINFVKN
jgi:predicted SAM-dependent methyltransferase